MEKLTKKQIDFLNLCCVGKWEQTDKGIIVKGGICIFGIRIIKIPVKIYEVEKGFFCACNCLTTLEGMPYYIGGGIDCSSNKLTSLEGIGEVKENIYCYNNKIDYRKEKELRPEIYKKIQLSTLEKMLVEC